MNRRTFLKRSTLLAGGFTARWRPSVWAQPAGAAADIRVAVIGLGNKGNHHAEIFSKMPGVRLVALCDLDPKRLATQVEKRKRITPAPFTTTDPRRVLERSDVDAVVIAVPNHWHALLAVWACEAGKDVYVEKPLAHSLWEGAQVIAATKKHRRVVQVGTQFRSDEGLQAAAQWLQAGNLGRPTHAHVVWFEQRDAISRKPPYFPDWLDYDLYCGPAPKDPLIRNSLHYDWHWVWATGDGELGNSGIHAFDVCRWFSGVGMPRRVMAVGGRYVWDDVGETPNTLLTLADYAGLPMLIETRNLPRQAGARAMDALKGTREGFALYYESGYFLGLRGGGWIYDRNHNRLRQFSGDGGGKHTANFIEAVRERRPELLRAPLPEGHCSTAVCLLGNISHRLAQAATPAECRRAVERHGDGADAFDAVHAHLKANEVDLGRVPLRLGPWLDVSGDTISGLEGGDASLLERARLLARGTQRKGFEFPALG